MEEYIIKAGILVKIWSCLVIDWQLGYNIPLYLKCSEHASNIPYFGCKLRQYFAPDMSIYLKPEVDELVYTNPPLFQWMNWISAIIFGAFYLFFLRNFSKSRKISPFFFGVTMIYVGASLYAMTIYLGVVLSASSNPLLVISANAIWFIIPLLMAKAVYSKFISQQKDD